MSATTVRVDLAGRSYDIAIGPGLIDHVGEFSTGLLAGKRVIIVSDDIVAERYGARVTSVATSAAALTALQAECPDILVSDIGLPDVDGLELIKRARELPATNALPAIALTAYASRQDAVRTMSAGFDAHVAKPVQPGTLGSTVARLIAAARACSSLTAS